MPIRRVRGRPLSVKAVSRGMALANTCVTVRGDPYERVGKALGVALARQHVHAQGARGRQDAAAAQCQRSQQRRAEHNAREIPSGTTDLHAHPQ